MRPKAGWDVLQHEIREEQAATIGRLGRDLRAALDALDTFDRRARGGTMASDRRDAERMRLVEAAGYALWSFVVQRDCSGLRFTEEFLKDYAVPAEGAREDGRDAASLAQAQGGYVGLYQPDTFWVAP